MARLNSGILNNPVVIGVATGAITWFLFENVLEKQIKGLFGKGKKKGKRVIRNKFGEVTFVDDIDVYDTDIDVYDTDVDFYDE